MDRFAYVTFMDQVLPGYLANGHHSRFIAPVAQEICRGEGLDVGCGKPEWALSGAHPIDLTLSSNALQLPQREGGWDYIFSSHCLEHIDDYHAALDHWVGSLRTGGALFLYLPHPDCLYWRPEFMPTGKHRHLFTPTQMREDFEKHNLKSIYASERDMAWSFAIFGFKG